MNLEVSNQNYQASEKNIKDALIAKGRTLANNNSQALKGMVEDNAFSAVVELVSSTVSDDVDIVYGIFMDVDNMAWVYANAQSPTGEVSPGLTLEDETSLWAGELESLDHRAIQNEGETVYEFAAPVIVDDDVLGVIRYGISTKTMEQLLRSASQASSMALKRNMSILIGVGFLAVIIGYLFTRRIANNITRPLASLSETAETIASGNYSENVNVKTDDEIGLLADNFEKMRSTIRKKMADLAKLNSTGEVLASILQQSEALEEVLCAMHDQIGISHGSVYLANAKGELEIKSFYPIESKGVSTDPLSFKLGEGIVGKAAQSGEVIYVENTGNHEGFVVGEKTYQKARSLLCIPLLDKDKLIGVMNCSGEEGTVNFEDADKEFAEAIARQLVITTKNIRMREVIEEQNRTLENKVEERTAELAQKTNDIQKMMAHMHQGLFTVMDGGQVHHEYASYLEKILNTDQIAGANLMPLLFEHSDIGSDKRDQIKVATESIIGEDEMMFDFNSHLLVTEYQKQTPEGKKVLELDWDPIVMDGQVEKLMVTVRDVTAIKELQGHAEAQKKELDTIAQILAVETAKFEDFLSTSHVFVKECRELIENTSKKDLDIVAALFRNMHTVKGNARTFGLSFITNIVHETENVYDEHRKDPDKVWQQEEMLHDLTCVETELKRYELISHDKLGRKPSSNEVNDAQGALPSDEVKSLLDRVNLFQSNPSSDEVSTFISDLKHTLSQCSTFTVNEVLSDVKSSVASLSKQLEKPEPHITVDDHGIRIHRDVTNLLSSVFMHVVRNALDHGIEGEQERLEKGKKANGQISLSVVNKDDQVIINIEDDGRGLALARIEEKAREAGMFTNIDDISDDTIANCIFSSGFSTADEVTDVSGRGVGMEAVKEFLETNSGSIKVLLSPGERVNGYRNFATQLTLPSSLFYVPTKIRETA